GRRGSDEAGSGCAPTKSARPEPAFLAVTALHEAVDAQRVEALLFLRQDVGSLQVEHFAESCRIKKRLTQLGLDHVAAVVAQAPVYVSLHVPLQLRVGHAVRIGDRLLTGVNFQA